MIEIREANKSQAAEIACLIMMAMTDDCCLYFCGEDYGLEELTSGRACSRSAEQANLRRSRLLGAFRKMMTMLVEREDSQYSYRNTLVAMDANRVVGISVSYDGGLLHELRRAFIEAAKEHFGKDHTGMDDETQAGELYLVLWPCYLNIAVKALPENCYWLPRNGPIVWVCHVSDYW